MAFETPPLRPESMLDRDVAALSRTLKQPVRMKNSPWSPVFLAILATAPLRAEPVLHVDPAAFTPEATLTLTFDRAVVTGDQVGKTGPNSLLRIDPPVAGSLKWIESNVAIFERSGVPPLASTFTFSVAEGRTHLDGSPIPAGKLRTLTSAPFAVEFGNWRGSVRTPRYYVRFNDEVDPAAVASYLSFADKEGREVAVEARRAVAGDASSSRALGPTWKQRFQGWKRPRLDQLAPEAALPTALVVTPAHPLAVGEGWKLIIKPGLPNASRTAALRKKSERWIGSVRPFEVSSINAVTRADSPRYISIGLSKALPEKVAIDALKGYLKIEPTPANMEIEAKRSLISIRGDFAETRKWKVTVKRGLLAADGLAMAESRSEEVEFTHLAPVLAAPSFAAAQLAAGNRAYSIETINIAAARIRVKQLRGEEAIRTFQGYRRYSGNGPGRVRFKERHPIPWSLVAGRPVYDQRLELDNPHDTSRRIDLDWDEVLGADQPASLLFVSIEGEPKGGMEPGQDKKKVTQVFLQLTDIGLAWKLNRETAFLYAYSCATGQPLAGVQLEVFGEDAVPLQSARTNEAGVARLPRTAAQRQLRASLGNDSVITDFDDRMPTVSMWRFPVRTEWNPELPNRRTAFLFTDRALYRPGEEVHLKGIVRRIENNRSVFDSSPGARLVIRDSSSRVLVERDLALSSQGSFDYSFHLPAETVGFFSFQLHWPEEVAAAQRMKNWRERAAVLNSARFIHNINVQEFRRNAFELQAEFAGGGSSSDLQLDLTARYYQGQPVAEAEVKWFYRSHTAGFYPAGYRDYLFCDHRTYDPYYWSHHFGYREDSSRGRNVLSKNGQVTLDRDGLASIPFTFDATSFPTPREVAVTCEVRDQRNQTLSTRAATTLHSSGIYLGVSRVDRLVRVGDPLDLKAVAVTSAGELVDDTVAVTLRIEREVHQQVKTKTRKGAIAVRDEVRLELLEDRPLTIDAAHNKEGGLLVPFRPTHPGKHILTFSGTDRDGKEFRTAVIHHVYGTKEYPWAYQNGMLIKLVPEKKRYRPGETARVLVLSPIEGTALVTLEREGVLRHFTRELSAEDPVVEIPVTEGDAPNAFVSVLVIKGSRDSQRKHKDPILRLGYCELMVENTRERLQIAMEVSGHEHRPGEEVAIEGVVRDSQGQAVEGAEVTLYAEDEGTLAVAGYSNPDPLAHFYAPRSLRIEAGASLGRIIAEDPEQRYIFNKGFFIGGGGGDRDLGQEAPRLRREFNPCAVWAPALRTGAEGRFRVEFVSPDTLTRYRVIAVAHHGADRFGGETAEFVIKKPLMLEPSAPRFAHEGDRLQPKVLVHNATSHQGTWRVTLEVGSITRFAEGSDRAQSKNITIPADGSATVSFDLTLADTGTVDWRWSATPLSIEGEALQAGLSRRLSDAVATSFEVAYPMPLLRETHFVRFEDPGLRRDLLDGFSKELLEGRGHLELEFGRSVLLEAGSALDFLLKYPYGCLEQTTSSTIPWIAARHLRKSAPLFRDKTDEEIRANIQAGANRLLSMQCDDGGLAYWPGGKQSTDWASAYGGMALLLCREAGAEVPGDAVQGLRKYLAGQLRGIAASDDWWDLETAARGCYTLALAGDPQVPYHHKLIERAGRLSPNALNFLALAVAKSGHEGAGETAGKLLEMRGQVPQRDGHFLHHHPSAAYRLLALATVQPGSASARLRSIASCSCATGPGHWRTTWANAWTVYALGEYARRVETRGAGSVIQLAAGGDSREIRLDDETPSESLRLPLHGELQAAALRSAGRLRPPHPVLQTRPRSQPVGLPQRAPDLAQLPPGPAEWDHRGPAATGRGDLVQVELQVTMPRDGTRYLVVDDPLPSLFEAVHTGFASQAGRVRENTNWRVSHRELRDDRAVFFLNRVPRSGTYKLSYYARVTSSGEAVAPPAKVEAMYEPEFFALSTSRRFETPNPLSTAMR